MEQSVNNLFILSDEKLTTITAGDKNAADMFLNGVGSLCMQTIPFPTPQIYLICAAGGAAASVLWPH